MQLLETLVVLYHLRTLWYVIDNAYVASDLAVNFGTCRADSLIFLGHLDNI
jgi:hypothetical protein